MSEDGVETYFTTRIKYGLILIIGFALSVFARVGGLGLLSTLEYLGVGCVDHTNSTSPEGVGGDRPVLVGFQCESFVAIYRISFSCFAFFVIQMVISAMAGCFASQQTISAIQNKFFFFKYLLFFGLLIVPFLVSNSATVWYAWLSAFGGGLFLLMQMIILLHMAYSWNDAWLSYDEEAGTQTWTVALLAFTIVAYIGCAVAITLLFIFFVGGDGCGFPSALIIVTTIFGCIATLLTFALDGSSLFTTGIIWVYGCYSLYSALKSGANDFPDHCVVDWLKSDVVTFQWTTVVSLIIAALSLAWTSVRSAGNQEAFMMDYDDDDEEERSFRFFHFVMALGSMYMAMLLTGWTIADTSEADTIVVEKGTTSLWVKIVAQWVMFLLYLWTMIAPKVFEDRDFE